MKMVLTNVQENRSQRIVIIDMLRGFALFGILIAHMAHLFSAFDSNTLYSGKASISDVIVSSVNGLFFSGKYFLIFSFLFGLSFFIQMDNAKQKSINYQYRFIWRLTILFFIGLLHSLLYFGDVLTMYALLGLPLVILYKAKDKVLVVLIIFFLSGAPRFIHYGIQNLTSSSNKLVENSIVDKANRDICTIFKKGSLCEVIKTNIEETPKYFVNYQIGIEGRAYQSFLLFLLGIIAGRRRFFYKLEENISKIHKAFKSSIWITVLLMVFTFGLYYISKGDQKEISFLIGMTFHNLYNLSFAVFLVLGFILLYQRKIIPGFFENLALYGKMGLTNYIMQTIISISLFYGFGLGLANYINLLFAVVIGIVIYSFQILYSKIWLNRFKYGPIEWLWRSVTWLKWQQFAKSI